jgi:hypothetical protein
MAIASPREVFVRKRLLGLIAVVVAVLAVGGIAAAEGPVTSVEGDVHAEFDGDFSPKTLSKEKRTPISSWMQARIKRPDGTHVAPLKELQLEGDRDVSFSVKGIPICKSKTRSPRTSPDVVRKECKESLVGQGWLDAEIAFEGQKPIPVKSELLLFKGGFENGVRTLYLHAYITVPTPASIITTVKVKRVRKGRYGLRAIATFPKIAGGSGSVTFLKLNLKKGILSAKCPDGRLAGRVSATFGSTPPTKLTSAVSRPCTGKD